LQEECYCRSGSNGLVSDFVLVKSKGGFSSKYFARVAMTVADVVAHDESAQIFGTGVDCVYLSFGSRIWDVAQDPLDE
jgi:hypothetical protein